MALPVDPTTPAPEGGDGGFVGEAAEPPHETAAAGILFDAPADLTRDIRLVKQAVKRRWETPKQVAEAVLLKMGATVLEAEAATVNQLATVAGVYASIERQNQIDEHHADKMDYLDRSLALRPKPNGGINIGVGAGGNVQIYIPDNFRDREDDPIDPELLLAEEGE